MPPPEPNRPVGFVPLGIFFYFGATMASYAAVTLAHPGTFLDRLWALNPSAHIQLGTLGPVMAVPFTVLAAVMVATGVGWFRRRRWAWILGVSGIAVNMLGDLVNALLGEWVKGAVGVSIAGLLLLYMTRPQVRSYFVSRT